jgi:hypothetical protein
MEIESRIPVLVAGASGRFGRLITQELLNNECQFIVSVLIRDPEKIQDLSQKILNTGGKIFKGDVCKPETLIGVTSGIHTVVSALNGDDSVLLEGQTNLLNDCIKNLVQRFVPSHYSLNIWNLPLGTHYFADLQLKFRERLEKTQVHGLYFTVGVFMEAYYSTVEKEGFKYWGDIKTKLDLISMKDAAKFVVAALTEKHRIGDIMIIGQELSTKKILETYNLVTGKKTEALKEEGLMELKQRIQELKKQGNGFEALKLGYMLLLYGGEGKIIDKMNEKFPNVKTVSWEEFLKEVKGKPMFSLSMMDIANKLSKEKLLQYHI